MLHVSRRLWRLFYLRLGCVFLALVGQGIAQGPTLTTVSDTVYRADGSPAAGTILISWPAFTAASGATVAAGNNHVSLGTNGSFTAQLAPNSGATPADTVYTVTYQLSDGTVKTENWSIGTSSPETISQVRTLAGTTTQLAQAATQQYVNAQLATVVHLSGTETITGPKQFTVSPVLPTPSQSGQAVNKGYVDSAVTNSGSGNFVAKAGDTMTGPLTLPADPTAPQQAAEVHYRGQYGNDSLLSTVGRAMARVTNPASITAEQRGIDNGIRGVVRHVKSPPARTTADCENAALALLSDGSTAGWTGNYEIWSDFLPGGAQDIFPGDALAVNLPSCSASFQAVVREVEIAFEDLAGEHSLYKIRFADDSAGALSFAIEASKITTALNITPITIDQVGNTALPDLTSAQVTQVASTTASIDAGILPQSGGGIEVRWSDSGWGQSNEQNLAGRFITQTFTLPRLAKVQDYFLRQYDASVPPKYSRHSAALHIDFPF